MEISEAILKEGHRRRFSERTIQTYIGCVERFFEWCKKEPKYATKKDVREYLEKLSDKNRAGNTINVNLMALKFYFENIIGRNFYVNIKYSKTPEKMPEVLTKEEVKKLIDSIKNPKHALMISFMYSAGLRVSELLNIKAGDLNLENSYGIVRNGKGGKDRLFIISQRIKPVFQRMINILELKDEDYIFLNNKNKKYSVRTIQVIIKKACKKAGIKKKVHPHTLRHSFATHLIENGYTLSDVQAMLGHKSPETSMVYVHMASPKLLSVKSPFDEL